MNAPTVEVTRLNIMNVLKARSHISSMYAVSVRTLSEGS